MLRWARFFFLFFFSGTHCVQALPLCGFGQTELGCYSRDGSTSLFRQLLSGPVTRSPTPLNPTLSVPGYAPPKHWQISGLDGATATCHRGSDSDIIVCDNVELQDPEHQLDG
jgi:hypothetical protein